MGACDPMVCPFHVFRAQAENFKLKGNQCYAQKAYGAAVDWYARAIGTVTALDFGRPDKLRLAQAAVYCTATSTLDISDNLTCFEPHSIPHAPCAVPSLAPMRVGC